MYYFINNGKLIRKIFSSFHIRRSHVNIVHFTEIICVFC